MKLVRCVSAAVVVFLGFGHAFSPCFEPSFLRLAEALANKAEENNDDAPFDDSNSSRFQLLDESVGAMLRWGKRRQQAMQRSITNAFAAEEEEEKRRRETMQRFPWQQPPDGKTSFTVSLELPSWLLPVAVASAQAKSKGDEAISLAKSTLERLNPFKENEQRSGESSDEANELSFWGYGWPTPGANFSLGGSWQEAEAALRALFPEGPSIDWAALKQLPTWAAEPPRPEAARPEAPAFERPAARATAAVDYSLLPPPLSLQPPEEIGGEGGLPQGRPSRAVRFRKAARAAAGGAWRLLSLRRRLRQRGNSSAEAASSGHTSPSASLDQRRGAGPLLSGGSSHGVSATEAAWLADLSDIVYLPDLTEATKARGLALVANGTTRDLRWVVADGVGSKSGRLVRSVVVSGARFVPAYSDPNLDVGRLLAALGRCRPEPLRAAATSSSSSSAAAAPFLARTSLVPPALSTLVGGLPAASTAAASGSSTIAPPSSGGGVHFHGGLLAVAEDLLVELAPFFNTCPPAADLRLVGHSLGGSTSVILRGLLAARFGYTPDAATAGLRPPMQVFAFGSVPVMQYRGASGSTLALEAEALMELSLLGLGSRDCHEFAMPWDPIPRMLSDDDFMGQWLRNRPAAATRVEKRAAMLQALFRGGWISANATHPSSSSSSSSNSRLELTAQAAAAVNATASKVAGAATEAALGLLPDVSGSGGGFGLSASSSEQRFAHVGTMHVIVPGSRRVSCSGRLVARRGAPTVLHLPASAAAEALRRVLPGDQVTGGVFGLTPRSFLKAYWAHFAYAKELAAASAVTAATNSAPVGWEEVFGSLREGPGGVQGESEGRHDERMEAID